MFHLEESRKLCHSPTQPVSIWLDKNDLHEVHHKEPSLPGAIFEDNCYSQEV